MAGAIVRNSLFSAIAGACTAIAGFVSMVIAARMLGVAGTGVVAYALWLVSMAVTILDFGLHSTLARYLPDLSARGESDSGKRLTAALYRPYLLLCVAGALAFCLCAAAHPGLSLVAGASWRSSRSILLLVATLGCLQVLSNFSLGQLRGAQRFDTAASITVVSLALQIAAVAIGGRLFGVPGVLAGYCLGAALLAVRSLKWTFAEGGAPLALLSRIVRFASYTWAGGVAAAFVWSRAEVFFLDRSWGAREVGLLTIGLTFSNLAVQGPLLLTGALLSFFSERVATNSVDVVNDAFATGTRILAFLAFPLCFGAAAVLPKLLPLVYGRAFDAAVGPGCVVVVASAFGAAGAVGTHMMYARDRSDFIFFSTLVGAALSIVAGLTIIPAYGLPGAAWSRAFVQIGMVALGCWFISRRLECPIPFGALGRLLAAAAACAVAARIVVVAVEGAAALPLAIGVGAVVYPLMVRALQALPPDDIRRLRAIGDRLPRSVRWLPVGALRLVSSEM